MFTPASPWSAGDFKNGFAEFGLNIYPLMLIPLRHLGVDWQIAGKWFSVLVATLAVVPLWGWLRRMFDDRTALLACLVYALHGKLIAISPLIIRDSTFWLLLATALYFLWRAVNELRLAYYLAAGASFTLAVYTRTEGWLLLIPLLGWTASRWTTAIGARHAAGRRRDRLSGRIACVAGRRQRHMAARATAMGNTAGKPLANHAGLVEGAGSREGGGCRCRESAVAWRKRGADCQSA